LESPFLSGKQKNTATHQRAAASKSLCLTKNPYSNKFRLLTGGPASQQEYITNTNLFKIKESYERFTATTVFHTFKTFFLPITKNLKL